MYPQQILGVVMEWEWYHRVAIEKRATVILHISQTLAVGDCPGGQTMREGLNFPESLGMVALVHL